MKIKMEKENNKIGKIRKKKKLQKENLRKNTL
jgi:hypothetical protein